MVFWELHWSFIISVTFVIISMKICQACHASEFSLKSTQWDRKSFWKTLENYKKKDFEHVLGQMVKQHRRGASVKWLLWDSTERSQLFRNGTKGKWRELCGIWRGFFPSASPRGRPSEVRKDAMTAGRNLATFGSYAIFLKRLTEDCWECLSQG